MLTCKVPGVHKDLREVVFGVEHDSFLSDHAHSNFGEVGQAIRTLVDAYQVQTKGHENIETIDDMKVCFVLF